MSHRSVFDCWMLKPRTWLAYEAAIADSSSVSSKARICVFTRHPKRLADSSPSR